MSLWNHLPLRLHGAVFEPCTFGYGAWHWIDRDGTHRHERMTSNEWHFFDPMASVMRRHYEWWIVTGRAQALRNGLFVPPWKMGGDAWHSVGILDAESAVPWPWPRGQKVSGDNLGH